GVSPGDQGPSVHCVLKQLDGSGGRYGGGGEFFGWARQDKRAPSGDGGADGGRPQRISDLGGVFLRREGVEYSVSAAGEFREFVSDAGVDQWGIGGRGFAGRT